MKWSILCVVVISMVISAPAEAVQANGSVYNSIGSPVVGRTIYVGWYDYGVQYVKEVETGACGWFATSFSESEGYPVIVVSDTDWRITRHYETYIPPPYYGYNACGNGFNFNGYFFGTITLSKGGDWPNINNPPSAFEEGDDQGSDESHQGDTTWGSLKALYRWN